MTGISASAATTRRKVKALHVVSRNHKDLYPAGNNKENVAVSAKDKARTATAPLKH